MSLKVSGGSGSVSKGGSTAGVARTQAGGGTQAGRALEQTLGGPGTDTKVQITPLSAHLSQLERVLNSVSIVDSARVDAIKQAITEGRFNVSSEAVADKLLETVRAHLLSPARA